MNLISNAIKFTSYGGITVTGETRLLENNNVEIKVIVEDTGCGMDEEEMKYIFDRFAQSTQRTHAEYGGSGLGLFISKNLVELMGGKLSVESVKWQSSKLWFTVVCPLVVEDQVQRYWQAPTIENISQEVSEQQNTPDVDTIDASTSPEAPNTLKILVVEDNKINQKVLVQILEKAHCTCTVANDGVEGLEHYQRNKFNLVFMDVAMPR